MPFLFTFFGEVSSKRFLLILNIVDIVLYLSLAVTVGSFVVKRIEYIFPAIVWGSFFIFSCFSLYSALRNDHYKYRITLYYVYMRAYMNYVNVITALGAIIYTLLQSKKLGYFFAGCVALLAFEIIFDFYWTVQLRDTIELLHYNHKLKLEATKESRHKPIEPDIETLF